MTNKAIAHPYLGSVRILNQDLLIKANALFLGEGSTLKP